MVTAELAAGLPALLLFVLVGVAAVEATVVQVRCVDAARDAALAAARGQSGVTAGRRLAPEGAQVAVTGDDGTVTATVVARFHPFGLSVPGLDVSARAVAAREPGVPAALATSNPPAPRPPALGAPAGVSPQGRPVAAGQADPGVPSRPGQPAAGPPGRDR